MDRVHTAPQSRADWLALARNGREVRGQAGEDGIALYTNKRSFFGKTFAFVKDPLFAAERAEQRAQGQNALRDFLLASTGLSASTVKAAFERAGIGEGTPLTQEAIQRAFDEVDRDVRQVGARRFEQRPDFQTITRQQVLAGIENRELSLADLCAHLRARSGLPPDTVDDAFRRIGLHPGAPTTEKNVNLALGAVDYELALIRLQGQDAPKPMTATRELDQPIDINALPEPVRAGIQANNGCLTGEAITALIRSGQLDLGIAPDDPALNVRTLPRSGAQTLGLFLVSSSAGNLLVKEHGGPYLAEQGQAPLMLNYERSGDAWQPIESNRSENPSLQRLARSPFGDTSEIDAPGGARMLFGHARATFGYVARGNVETVHAREERQVPVQHQVSVLHGASGIELSKVMEFGTEQQKCDAARDFGRAVGAMHMQFTDHQLMPTGGLRTLIHGDLHPGNVFYDPESHTITAIDLSGAGANFRHDPPGYDMIRDLARALKQGTLFEAGEAAKQAFLEGYCENPEIARLGYTPDSLRALINQPGLDSTALT